MKEVKLVERKSSERLIGLVDAIPELEINEHGFVESEIGNIYCSKSGDIHFGLNAISKNPLKNAYKLKECIDECVFCITEESFCDLLYEHLYLVAKEKMEELLPQIQEHYPDAILKNDQILIMLDSENPEWVAEIQGTQAVAGWGGSYGQHDIWEDADRLIVKKPKPWWEKQDYYWTLTLNAYKFWTKRENHSLSDKHDIEILGKANNTFQTHEEAQEMCDKLNAVLKGE